VVDRGLVPRLSIGTLQLSIRCSSIHFLPRRSLPVRVLAFGVGWSRGEAFCATADNVRQSAKIEKIEMSDPLDANCMDGLANH
jgi:hypothetical protein